MFSRKKCPECGSKDWTTWGKPVIDSSREDPIQSKKCKNCLAVVVRRVKGAMYAHSVNESLSRK